MILWIIDGLWRVDFERRVGLEISTIVCGFGHRDQSVCYNCSKVYAVCDNYAATETRQPVALCSSGVKVKAESEESLPAARKVERVPHVNRIRVYKLLTR